MNYHRPINFFILTYAWSWPLWLILGLTSQSLEGAYAYAIFALAGIGPSLMGLVFARRSGNAEHWKRFVRRIFDPRFIGARWYAFIFAIIPLTSLVALGLYLLSGNIMPSFETFSSYLANPATFVSFAAFTFLFGPIPEEIGWRGFAQDRLEPAYGWAKAGLIIGVGWAIWHIPLFLIPGSYQNGLFDTSNYLVMDFFIQFLFLSVIACWIRHRNRGSILSAILFHFAVNYVGEIMELPAEVMYLRTFVQAVLVLIIVTYDYRKRRNKRK